MVREGWIADDEAFPTGLGRVVELLQRLGYAVDADKVASFASRGVCGFPDRNAWYAADVLGLSQFLEARREWQPVPSPHDVKKTAAQIELETWRAAGRHDELADEFAKLDLRHALVMMAEFERRADREKLFVAVQVLLDREGVRL